MPDDVQEVASPPSPEPQAQQPTEEAVNVSMDETAMTVTLSVQTYRAGPDGRAVLDAHGERIPERLVGPFIFRVPTLDDLSRNGVRYARALEGMSEVAMIAANQERALFLASALSTLPHLATSVPDGWRWERLYRRDEGVVYAAMVAFAAQTSKF